MTEWDATAYAEHSGVQEAMAVEPIARLDLGGAERVLDVGCGDGKVTAKIAERVPRGSILGVDPSRAMIDFAAARFPAADRPNLRFAVADARHLPYRGEFDLVVSFNALHWVPEMGEALRSIRGALRPGGRATLRFVPGGMRPSLEDVIEEVRSGPAWAAAFADFRRPFIHPAPAAYRALAEREGFRVDDLRVRDESWDFGTRAAFADFARATFVEWTGRLPADARDAFIGQVLDRYRAAAAVGPGEANTFKFYQLEITLAAPG